MQSITFPLNNPTTQRVISCLTLVCPYRDTVKHVALMQCKVIEGCQIPLITLRYIKPALLLQGKAAFIPSP